MNFWQQLSHPISCLAPMEDVTDTVFREIILRRARPEHLQVLFTEFTSTDGLCHPEAYDKVAERLMVSRSEQNLLLAGGYRLVAQIWGTEPALFARAAEMITRMERFDGIDINMGCPVKKIIKGGGCSALILDPPRAKAIIRATRAATNLPVSVKTRIGFYRTETESWMEHLLETEPAAIILHARTSKDQSLVPARWEEIARAVEVRDRAGNSIPLIGNGDVTDPEDGIEKCRQFGADGFMIGRGIFQHPWMFDPQNALPDVSQRLEALLEHARLFTATWEEGKPFQMLKRFFKIYVNAFPGAAGLRARLMETHSLEEAEEVIRGFSTPQRAEEMAG